MDLTHGIFITDKLAIYGDGDQRYINAYLTMTQYELNDKLLARRSFTLFRDHAIIYQQ